jgi:hypothetical protein
LFALGEADQAVAPRAQARKQRIFVRRRGTAQRDVKAGQVRAPGSELR